MRKKAIVALGGNALIKEGQDGNIYDQFDNTREVSTSIVKMIQDGKAIKLWENHINDVSGIWTEYPDAYKDLLEKYPEVHPEYKAK